MEPNTASAPVKQMAWLSAFGSDGTKILHLRESPTSPWRPYTAFPQYSVPDYKISGGSAGFATSQALLKKGWTYVSSDEAIDNLSFFFANNG